MISKFSRAWMRENQRERESERQSEREGAMFNYTCKKGSLRESEQMGADICFHVREKMDDRRFEVFN